jgi:hypothetical protein
MILFGDENLKRGREIGENVKENMKGKEKEKIGSNRV